MERDQRPDAEDDDEHDEQADREPISEISGAVRLKSKHVDRLRRILKIKLALDPPFNAK